MKTLVRDYYETFDALLASVCDESKRVTKEAYASHREKETDWAGTSTFDDAINLARYGWPEGREKMVSGMSEAVALKRPSAYALAYDVAGAYPDIVRYVGGDPMNMVTPGWEETNKRQIVPIVINVAASSAVSTEAIINRGVAVLTMIDEIEAAGYRVELTISWCCEANVKPVGLIDISVIAKRAEDHLSLDTLAFMLAHPSMIRRVFFAAYEQHAVCDRDGMYGMPNGTPAYADNCVYFHALYSRNSEWQNYLTIEGAVNRVRELIGTFIAAR